MKKYESPKLELTEINVEDVITVSNEGPGNGEDDMGWMSLERPVNVIEK